METFVARQPILDQHQQVYGYELLYRSSWENVFTHADPNQASATVMTDGVALLGMDTLTNQKKAFINIPHDILVDGYVTLLPQKTTVVEILETVDPTPQVIAACKKLKDAGYILALDDFVYEERFEPLVRLADIIKIDVLTTPQEQWPVLLKQFTSQHIQFLAEKVETREVFQETSAMGFSYFQGYFFSKPEILSKKDVPRFKQHYLELLQQILKQELDYDQLEEIIKRDLSLCYKLLRYINSAAFPFRRTIDSISHALALLGEKEFRKWASLLTLASLGSDKPEELVSQATVRAKFCESLTAQTELASRTSDAFLMGLFSLLDAIIDRPLDDILSELSVTEDVQAALLEATGPLHAVYATILAYERGEWQAFSTQIAQLGVDESEVPTLYREAVDWGQQSVHACQDAEKD